MPRPARAYLTTCGALVLLLLSLPIARLPMTLSIDYNEGLNAYHAADAIAGRQLYPPDVRAIGYPPLSYYVVGAIGRIGGDQVIAGRVIALASLIGVAIAAGWIVVLLGGDRNTGTMTAILTVGLVAALAPSYVAMNDPELLAHAVMLPALGMYVRGRKAGGSARLLIAVAALIVAALFMKHTLLALPVAIGWDLWRRSRRDFAIWGSALVGLLVMASAIVQLMSGGRFVTEIVLRRELVFEHWLGLAGSTLLRLAPLLVVAMPILWRAPGDLEVLRAYFVASLVGGLGLAAGAGTDVNFFFDLFVATAIAIGIGLSPSDMRERARARRARAALVLGCLLVAVPFRVLTPARYRALTVVASASRADRQFLASIDGDTMCENVLLCYWAGKPFALDPYLVGEKIVAGRLAEADVEAIIASKRFRVIQTDAVGPPLERDALHPGAVRRRGRYTEQTLVALHQSYRLSRESANGAFYIPK